MLGNGFYRKMAADNIRRSREVYLPYLLAAAIIGCVYFLVVSMSFAENLTGVPGGENARLMFAMGTVVFTIFAFCFLLSINRFLIKQRKKEFGLYGVLGLSKGHVGRILVWENAMVLLGGLCLGLVFALMFGKLLFLVLLKLMRSLPSLDFSPSPLAYLAVIGLFLAVFVCTCLYNLAQVHLSNPIQLMQSQRQGEKDSRLVVPKAILGLLLLGAAYYFAWTIQNYGMAMGVFFLLVLMVIIATYFLFQAGSIAILRLLRANKRFYYQPSHFVTVSSMFHRMRQNASSLAGICILSTMLTVTLTGTLALYLGQEETLKPLYPYNVCYHIIQNEENPDPQMTPTAIDAFLAEQAQAQGLTMSAQTDGRLVHTENTQNEGYQAPLVGFLVVYADSTCQALPHSILLDDYLYFDLAGPEDACLDFVEQIPAKMAAAFGAPEEDFRQINDIFSARQTGYGTYGGLLFLGAFFSILFLAVAVLMLYFKQITEGNEDRERFALLQKVGMDQTQVHRVINSQVMWVFFLPLGATLLHMVFASRILSRMLGAFNMSDFGLAITCAGFVSLGFALLYWIAYRLTARVYYRIVRWGTEGRPC